MRRTGLTAAGVAAALVLSGTLAAADDHATTQTVAITIEDVPLELTLTSATIEFVVDSGEDITSTAPFGFGFKQEAGGSLRITTPSAGSALYQLAYSRSNGGDDLRGAGGDGSLWLRPVAGDFPAVLRDRTPGVGQFNPSSISATGSVIEPVMVNNLPPALSEVDIPLLWRIGGTAPSSPSTIVNTVTFTIAEQ